MNVKNIVMYLRKSRNEEHETVEEVLSRHETILQEYAVKNFGEVIPEENIYREIVSGETIQNRPEIQKILNIIASENIQAILVIEPQRLSRGDMQDAGTICRALQYTNTVVITPQKRYNLADKFDKKFFEMELRQGNEYLEYIKEIMQRGTLHSVKQGNYVGSVAPYGYNKAVIDKCHTLTINEEESTVVKLIFDLFVNELYSPNQIALHLDSLGFTPRKNKNWSAETIRCILRNPIYTGKIKWNARKTIKTYESGKILSRRPRNQDYQLYDGKHPAIIDEELFNKAQKRFGTLTKIKIDKEPKNILAGLLYCECGTSMALQKQYSNIQNRIVCRNQAKCRNKSVIYSDLLQFICDNLEKYIEDFKLEMNSTSSNSKTVQESTLKSLKQQLNKLKEQQEKLFTFLEDGTYDKQTFTMRNKANIEKQEKIKKSIEELEKSIPSSIDYKQTILNLKKAIKMIKSNKFSVKDKNYFLKSIIDKIVYSRPVDEETRKYQNQPFYIDIYLKI